MALRLAQLPLVFDCPRFEPMSEGDGTTCARCREVVHDLSGLTETEVRRFFSHHAGRPVCVSARVDRGGSLVLRDAPRCLPAAVGLFALLIAAGCASAFSPEVEPPSTEEAIVRGIVITQTLFPAGDGDGYVGTRKALPDVEARRERRRAWRRLHGR